ncbi:MAG: hypothetical protein P8013_02110 [Candidatus Sulfobium sp.]|jgi:hypothetical protein
MRHERTFLLFITIIFTLCIADASFAAYAKETAPASPKSITVRTNEPVRMPPLDGRAEDGGMPDVSPGLSTAHAAGVTHYYLLDHSSEMFKVLSVVKKRVQDERLLKKIEEKLPALSDNRLQMVVSLSEQISSEGHSAKQDFAFLLLTTLIVFS